jgi:hypothetical protein
LRVLASNSVAIPLDNLIFTVGAFAWSLSWGTVWQIFLINLIVKFAVTLVSIPWIYLVPATSMAMRPHASRRSGS